MNIDDMAELTINFFELWGGFPNVIKAMDGPDDGLIVIVKNLNIIDIEGVVRVFGINNVELIPIKGGDALLDVRVAGKRIAITNMRTANILANLYLDEKKGK